MAMDMDEQRCQQKHRWFLQVQSGEEITLIPRDDEPLWVTDVFLVDRESAAGQGVVAACVEMGTRNIMLAQLSSERTDVELQTPLVLDEEFCFYVMRPGGDSDADADTHIGADTTVVQFEGFVLRRPDTNEVLEEEEEEGEEAASVEDNNDRVDEDYGEDEESGGDDEDYEESDGDIDRDVARASSPGSNAKDVRTFAARTFLGLFLFSYIVGFFRIIM